MSVLLWLPLWLGIIVLLLAIPVVSLLNLGNGPKLDTLLGRGRKRRRWTHKRRESNELEEASSLLHPSSPTSTQLPPTKQRSEPDLTQSIRNRFYIIIDIVTTYPRNFILLLTGFFLTSLASSDTKLLTQYISKRYHWKFSSVGYLMSGKAVFNSFLLYFIIPALLRWRERHRQPRPSSSRANGDRSDPGLEEQHRDHERHEHEPEGPLKGSKDTDNSTITHAHICLVFSVLGALAIGASSTIYLLIPSLLLYALGIALPMFTYSLLKSPSMLPPRSTTTRGRGRGRTRDDELQTDEGEGNFARAESDSDSGKGASGARSGGTSADKVASTAQIFSLVMLVKTSGMLVGAPLMASLWVYGVGMGGGGLGQPYFVSAVCYGLVVFIFSRIRV